jgi:hypothetical protein
MTVITLPRICATAAAAREILNAAHGEIVDARLEVHARAVANFSASFISELLTEALATRGADEISFRGLGPMGRQIVSEQVQRLGFAGRVTVSYAGEPTWNRGMYGAPDDLYSVPDADRDIRDARRSALSDAAACLEGALAHDLRERAAEATPVRSDDMLAALPEGAHGNRYAMYAGWQVENRIRAARALSLREAAEAMGDDGTAQWLRQRAEDELLGAV